MMVKQKKLATLAILFAGLLGLTLAKSWSGTKLEKPVAKLDSIFNNRKAHRRVEPQGLVVSAADESTCCEWKWICTWRDPETRECLYGFWIEYCKPCKKK